MILNPSRIEAPRAAARIVRFHVSPDIYGQLVYRMMLADSARWPAQAPERPHVARFAGWLLADLYADAVERYRKPGARRERVTLARTFMRARSGGLVLVLTLFLGACSDTTGPGSTFTPSVQGAEGTPAAIGLAPCWPIPSTTWMQSLPACSDSTHTPGGQ